MSTSVTTLPAASSQLPASLDRYPWILTFGRTGSFLAAQALFAAWFFFSGVQDPWNESVAWWPMSVSLANLGCIAVVASLYQAEGKRFVDVFRIQRKYLLVDLLLIAASMLVVSPVSYFPNVWLSTWLFGDPTAVLENFVRPLPLWAAYACVIIFPITQGLIETPLYFSYAMPRLKAQGVPAWLAMVVTGLMLGVQHGAAPFVFEPRFIIWRTLMFIPFGLLTAAILLWRPRLQPYMAFIHIVMNIGFATMFLPLAY